jgi:multicomponent Na+:H+ antiporter subunit G
MTPIDALVALLLAIGAAFFFAGTVGLLRFPDVFTRLHALTKADNVGLGFVALGLAIERGSWVSGLRIGVVWLLVLVATAASSHLVARSALRAGVRPEGS